MSHLQQILKYALAESSVQILSAVKVVEEQINEPAIESLAEQGKLLERVIKLTQASNPLFSSYMQLESLKAVANNYLTGSALERLFDCCAGRLVESKIVGIIMAGNIPAVGFHDLLCCLVCGVKALVKLSSKDKYLIPYICGEIEKYWPQIREQVEFLPSASDTDTKAGRLYNECDALIFSGSDESLWEIKRELRTIGKEGIPLLARGSRFSFGVLDGGEDKLQLTSLAEDMFLYCGLGCRSISTLFVPDGYDLSKIVENSSFMRSRLEHIPPYINSYRRLKALAAMQGNLTDGASAGKEESYTDGEFFLLKTIGSEIEKIEDNFPPLGVVNVRYYSNENEIIEFERANSSKIQKKYSKFGKAQQPQIDEWMDGVNTIEFILSDKS
ncbi:MAG: hypothetical protein IKI67_02670 [Bacteroidales bacterium]|nr:hypothetical protein [Bacteroidales bacterium]